VQTDILIIGGGAGGLKLATHLGRHYARREGSEAARRRVMLVDRSAIHLWKPTLHEIAAGTLDAHQEGLAYTLLARRNHFRFVMGEFDGLDLDKRCVRLAPVLDPDGEALIGTRTISFDHLVLAMGSGTNLFDTEGAAEHTHRLEDAEDARAFQKHLSQTFLAAAFSDERRVRTAIVGGGATGVELAAELIEAHRGFIENLPREQHFKLDVTLIEMAERLLGPLPEQVAEDATRSLVEQGVEVRTSTRVKRIDAQGLHTDKGRIETDLVVWAAGMKADPLNARLGLSVNKLNQIKVDTFLRTEVPCVWAMGDCAEVPGPDDKPVPARAQAAAQQALWLGRALPRFIAGERVPRGFRYRDQGSLVALGDHDGAGALRLSVFGRRLYVEGLVARFMYMMLHLNHHRSILGVRRTAVLALARLMHRRVTGRLKLH
jgi:NADH:ubiquinone reductase (H+-translocating)